MLETLNLLMFSSWNHALVLRKRAQRTLPKLAVEGELS